VEYISIAKYFKLVYIYRSTFTFMTKKQSILNCYNKQTFQDLVSSCKSKGDLVNALKLSVSGSSYNIVQEIIDLWNIDTSSLQGRAWNKGKHLPKKYTTEDLLNNKQYIHTSALKKRLLKEGILENVCSLCGIKKEWNGKPIILHLDHIDGNRFNNSLLNLRILCPNCHSQTNTYCRKNNN
jgi:RNA polymerase subunit RPABC4/transcription elongation factor Spt4